MSHAQLDPDLSYLKLDCIMDLNSSLVSVMFTGSVIPGQGVKTISCYHGDPSWPDHVPTIYISQSTLVLNNEVAFYPFIALYYQTLLFKNKTCQKVCDAFF